MSIYFDRSVNKYALNICGTVYGHYPSAEAAADDVFTFSTGCFEWDSLCDDIDLSCSIPDNISEWIYC